MIPRLRWWIGGLLFASTAINYIDRQTLSVLAPYLQREFSWSSADYALVLAAFRVAYALVPSLAGPLLDRIGTRRGLLLSVTWYSVAAMLTSLARGLPSFAAFRFLLGTGEAANWPGATKAVAEWFPKAERGWAVALFDSGSAVGGAVAPWLVLWLYHTFGSWRPAFVFTGLLGLLWALAWRFLYHPPEEHPRLSPQERDMILKDRVEEHSEGENTTRRPAWHLLQMGQTWGIILGRMLTDPVWFFISDWFAIYLVSRGFSIEGSALGFWAPFLAADFGNFFGGGLSSYLIRRGWPVLRARKFVLATCGLGMTLLIPAVWVQQFSLLIALFAVSSFCYAAWSTMALALPADLYASSEVASVSGFTGTGSGLGTILSTLLIGRVADHYSFAPVLIAASVIPLMATLAVFTLVKETNRLR